jgi:hypothetical protein
MNHTFVAEAIQSLRPGAAFVLRGDQLEWLDQNQIEPTAQEIAAEAARLEADEPWQQLRAERDRRLAECDWVVTRAVDLSNDGLGIQLEQVWVQYRQALRDLPANTTDPANPVWPTKPGSN